MEKELKNELSKSDNYLEKVIFLIKKEYLDKISGNNYNIDDSNDYQPEFSNSLNIHKLPEVYPLNDDFWVSLIDSGNNKKQTFCKGIFANQILICEIKKDSEKKIYCIFILYKNHIRQGYLKVNNLNNDKRIKNDFEKDFINLMKLYNIPLTDNEVVYHSKEFKYDLYIFKYNNNQNKNLNQANTNIKKKTEIEDEKNDIKYNNNNLKSKKNNKLITYKLKKDNNNKEKIILKNYKKHNNIQIKPEDKKRIKKDNQNIINTDNNIKDDDLFNLNKLKDFNPKTVIKKNIRNTSAKFRILKNKKRFNEINLNEFFPNKAVHKNQLQE